MGATEDFERFSSLADELGIENDEKEPHKDKFIHEAMTRKGYKPRMTYDEPEPQQEGKSGATSLFGPPRRQNGEGQRKSGSQYS